MEIKLDFIAKLSGGAAAKWVSYVKKSAGLITLGANNLSFLTWFSWKSSSRAKVYTEWKHCKFDQLSESVFIFAFAPSGKNIMGSIQTSILKHSTNKNCLLFTGSNLITNRFIYIRFLGMNLKILKLWVRLSKFQKALKFRIMWWHLRVVSIPQM